MKTIYKSILVIGLGITSLTVSAQKDTTLIRQVSLERDYNPTLQSASKINTMPAIYSPVVSRREPKFVGATPQITLVNNKLAPSEAGEVKTDINFDKKRGYLIIGAGSNANIDGALGYRIVDAKDDQLDVFATHSSTVGTVNYLDGNKYLYKDAKAKYSDSKISLRYQHTFEPSILSFDVSYNNKSFNYYGNSFLPKDWSGTFMFDADSRQNVGVFNIGVGLRSTEKNDGFLKYNGYASYSNFSSKYGSLADKGVKGGQLNLTADVYAELEADKTVGIVGQIMNQTFSHKLDYFPDAHHGFTNITGTPYIKFLGENWEANLGANFSSLLDTKVAFALTPNVKAHVCVNEVNTFYAEIGGGVNNNTFLDILQENRYVNPATRVEYSRTLYDAKIGFKSGIVRGLEFDLFAGYKYTTKDHLYVYAPTQSWANVSNSLYANISTGHIGGLLKTNLIPYTDLSAKVVGYFYNVKYRDAYVEMVAHDAISESKAWGRPMFTAELNADVKPIDKLTLSLNYLYAGGRKAYLYDATSSSVSGKSYKMSDINELNFKGEYQIMDWVSVHARLNNIFFQKYEMVHGYPLQGFNILGGLSLKF